MEGAKVMAAFDTYKDSFPSRQAQPAAGLWSILSIREQSPVAATRNGNRIALAQAMAPGLGVIYTPIWDDAARA
jgi:hypothetical protein